MSVFSPQVLLTIIFLTLVTLHISKKNFWATIAYALQSLAIVAIFITSFFEHGDITLLFIAGLTLFVKVIMAPIFFIKLVQKHSLVFSVSTYLNTPLTLIVITILTTIAHSDKLAPLTGIIASNETALGLALSSMLLSLFLIVNRKGALSQIIGILSFENSIIAFAVFAGLEQSFGLQAGIIFDIALWLVIATVFLSMLYKHFGSLDVTSMKKLIE